MSVNSVMSAGLKGLRAGIDRADQAAGKIARAGASDIDSDLATNIVDLKISEYQIKSAAVVIKTGNQLLGTLIDIDA